MARRIRHGPHRTFGRLPSSSPPGNATHCPSPTCPDCGTAAGPRGAVHPPPVTVKFTHSQGRGGGGGREGGTGTAGFRSNLRNSEPCDLSVPPLPSLPSLPSPPLDRDVPHRVAAGGEEP